MDRRQRMHKCLQEALAPQFLEVEDQSARHEGHAGARPGGETHYRVKVVTDRFSGMGRVERHRTVFDLLAKEREGGIHALSLELLTPDEAKPGL